MSLVQDEDIHTQDELASRLEEEGIEVTQATVSRDIKQLGLIKIPLDDGGYKYSLPPKQKDNININSRMKRMFEDSVSSIDYSENLVVINTLPGTAQAVASLIDNTEWKNVLGTIAGDDTILMIVKPKSAVTNVIERLKSLTV
jgi:transcriptional regulator of arginine metabolism